MVSRYWQVEVGGKDRSAFCTPYMLYELCHLDYVMGLRLMDLVLAGLQMSQCLVYIDDAIVIGRTFEEQKYLNE